MASLTTVVLLLPGCGDTDDAVADTTLAATTAAPTTRASETTTTTTTTTTAAFVTDSGVTIASDVVYLEMDGDEYLTDVYVPLGEGPWPVVVALHGGNVYKNESGLTTVAEAAAEAGMLVFVPNWVASWPSLSEMDAQFVQSTQPALECSLAYAQQEAVGYGGDPDRTVVYGFSGGATSGNNLVVVPTSELHPGCVAQVPPTAPVGAVLGDAEYFYHATWWDGAFDKDAEAMQRIVAERIDPALWAIDPSSRFRLFAAANESFPRAFDDPWDEDGWFALRDPDGTIRKDLDEMGELDDGDVSFMDSGILLASRLKETGIDTTFDILPGGHNVDDYLPEVVAYLLDVTGTS